MNSVVRLFLTVFTFLLSLSLFDFSFDWCIFRIMPENTKRSKIKTTNNWRQYTENYRENSTCLNNN